MIRTNILVCLIGGILLGGAEAQSLEAGAACQDLRGHPTAFIELASGRRRRGRPVGFRGIVIPERDGVAEIDKLGGWIEGRERPAGRSIYLDHPVLCHRKNSSAFLIDRRSVTDCVDLVNGKLQEYLIAMLVNIHENLRGVCTWPSLELL
jgi:hypothetical protein